MFNHHDYNHIYFYEGVSHESIQKLIDEIETINGCFESTDVVTGVNLKIEPKPILLHIHSYGGSVFAGISGMKAIENSKIPITTIVDGVAASAATFLALAGKVRLINPHAFMLIHQISTSGGNWGKFSDIEKNYSFMKQIMKDIKDIYKKYTSMDTNELDELLKRDVFWDAQTSQKFLSKKKKQSKKKKKNAKM